MNVILRALQCMAFALFLTASVKVATEAIGSVAKEIFMVGS
jgi:hypothetical protein